MVATSITRLGLVLVFVLSAGPAFGYGKSAKQEDISREQAAKLESKFIKNARQLTFDGENGEAYFSPDGKKIIFQSIRGEHPFYQIYTLDLASGETTLVSTGKGRTTCAYFHPNGKQILFGSSHLDPEEQKHVQAEKKYLSELRKDPRKRRKYSWNFDPYMEIFSADLDGKNLKNITNTEGYDAEGAYSADGNLIAFTSTRNGNAGNLYVMNADGSNVRQLTDSPGYDGGPFISPDMKKVIFRGEVRSAHKLQIFAIDIDGKNETQLTDNDDVNWAPYWFKDSRHIIYTTSRHGHRNFELYVMDSQTKKETRVTFTGGSDVLPVFSPDGTKLLWTSTRGLNKQGRPSSQIWIADWVYDFQKLASH